MKTELDLKAKYTLTGLKVTELGTMISRVDGSL